MRRDRMDEGRVVVVDSLSMLLVEVFLSVLVVEVFFSMLHVDVRGRFLAVA